MSCLTVSGFVRRDRRCRTGEGGIHGVLLTRLVVGSIDAKSGWGGC